MSRLAPVLAIVVCIYLDARARGETTPAATYANVRYGPHERNILDVWLVESNKPSPLVVHIHGGGWKGGDKLRGLFSSYSKPAFRRLRNARIAVASINYRYTSADHPLPAPLMDAARAIQFLRSKSHEWDLDKERFAAYGASAGGCSTLWLAFHDEVADPDSDDPIERESSRLLCAAAINAQSSIAPDQLRVWIGPLAEEHGMIRNAFGLGTVARSYEAGHRATYVKYSPITHLDKNDPPIFLTYFKKNSPAKDISHAIHHPIFGIKVKEAMDKFGVESRLIIADQPYGQAKKYDHYADFLVDKLTAAQ